MKVSRHDFIFPLVALTKGASPEQFWASPNLQLTQLCYIFFHWLSSLYQSSKPSCTANPDCRKRKKDTSGKSHAVKFKKKRISWVTSEKCDEWLPQLFCQHFHSNLAKAQNHWVYTFIKWLLVLLKSHRHETVSASSMFHVALSMLSLHSLIFSG